MKRVEENELRKAETEFVQFHSMMTCEIERLAREEKELERELGNTRIRKRFLERTLLRSAKIVEAWQGKDEKEQREFEKITAGVFEKGRQIT